MRLDAKTLVLAGALMAVGSALAQNAREHMDHGGRHPIPAPSSQGDDPATRAFRDVAAQMHRDMDIRYTGDVDVDFVRGMIPHHAGAIAMAKVALQYSKNPDIRKLAEEVVKAQEAEVAQMQAFLKRKGG